ncbi:hypothetical protein ACED30_16085 [Vibrio splendidus]
MMMAIKKVSTSAEAIKLARRHAAEALKEQTLHSNVWCDKNVDCYYQSELYRLADAALALNDKK